MLIHVAVCGIGLGHVTRSVSVAEELMRRGHSVTFSSYGQGYEYLVNHGIPSARATAVSYGVGGDGTVSVKRTILNNVFLFPKFLAQTVSEEVMISNTWADVVLSDTRASAALAAKTLKKPVATILNQYNLRLEAKKHRRLAKYVEQIIQAPQLIWNLSEKIIVPDLPPPHTIAEATLNFPEKILDKVVYTGPLIQETFHSNEEIKSLRSEYGADVKRLVLIVAGGGEQDKASFVAKFKKIGENLSNDYVYVLSAATPSSRETEKIGPLFVKGWIPDMDAFLKAADVVVSRGGLTLITKCIMYGKPMIIVPTPQHGEQIANALKAEWLGVGKAVDLENLSPHVLESALERLVCSEETLEKLVFLQSVAQKCGGVKAAADVVESLY